MAATSPDEGDRPNGPRSRKGVQTRARLVEAAKGVFEDDGFLNARVSDIAERAGMSHGSFYHYFDSKDEVFLEVAEGLEERLTFDSVVESGLLYRALIWGDSYRHAPVDALLGPVPPPPDD